VIRAAIVFLPTATVTVAAQEPPAVAAEALAAWRAGDAKRLNAVAHPEFMKRCRDARIVLFYVEAKPEKKKALAAGSDADALALLCEALQAIVSRKE
jgi:hypothetical protein